MDEQINSLVDTIHQLEEENKSLKLKLLHSSLQLKEKEAMTFEDYVKRMKLKKIVKTTYKIGDTVFSDEYVYNRYKEELEENL